jgi:hypothetical protein
MGIKPMTIKTAHRDGAHFGVLWGANALMTRVGQLLLPKLDPAAAEFQNIQPGRLGIAQKLIRQCVGDESALLARCDDSRRPKQAEMMGHIGDRLVHLARQIADVFGSGLKTLDQLQAIRIGQRLQIDGTF